MKYNSKYGMKHPPRKIAGGQLNVLKHTTHIISELILRYHTILPLFFTVNHINLFSFFFFFLVISIL